MDQQYSAKLIHGQTYVLGNTTFVKGQVRTVNEAQRKHLEKYAVDRTVQTIGEERTPFSRQKFVFAPIEVAEANTPNDEGPVILDDPDEPPAIDTQELLQAAPLIAAEQLAPEGGKDVEPARASARPPRRSGRGVQA